MKRRRGDSGLFEEMLLVPVKKLSLRVAKYDVVLRHRSLRAVQAMHTILTRMVVFQCKCCKERFPTFHPAYDPTDVLDLEVCKRKGKERVAVCNVKVASWDDLPPPPDVDEAELIIASCHTGMCHACQVDIDQKAARAGDADDFTVAPIVPNRSFLNAMDPCWKFPHQELGELFAMATLTESMLLSLEHMQVNYVTVAKSGLHKFRNNVISFPQDFPSFAARLGLLQRYQVGDRVNSVRGPGSDPGRRPRRADQADAEERKRHAVDESGYLVYAATVRNVQADGTLLLDYDDISEQGFEGQEHVSPRVRMPWHPKFLKGLLAIMLRRNVGHGRPPLEGLEIRWTLVSNILHAFTALGPWRMDESVGPMHQWYDPRLFDISSAAQIKRDYAQKGPDGQPMDALTAADLAEVGLDLRFVGPGSDDPEGEAEGQVPDEVDEDTFCQWLSAESLSLGTLVAKWWAALEPEPRAK